MRRSIEKGLPADMAKNQTSLRIIPLGGLDGIGKNMTAFEYGNDMVLVDAGLMFPDDEQLGVDLVLPDYSYVLENEHKLRGILITHGHEDHIGALPYLLMDLSRKVPIYSSKLTLGIIEGKLSEHRLNAPRFREVQNGAHINLGAFSIDFFSMTHSIPAALGIYMRTPAGSVLHTGDFKLDQTPIDGVLPNYQAISRFSTMGVDLLLSDSTNATRPGYTPSEAVVGPSLRHIIKNATGRVFVASFSSHIHRLQQVCDAAIAVGRKVVVTGRSMVNTTRVARDLGYLKIAPEDLIDAYDVQDIPDDRIVVLCTGSQGEPMAALSRIANGTHRQVQLQPGDTVIFSSSPIPGNTTSVNKLINIISEAGVEVIHGKINNIHTSGHGGQQEQKLMLRLIKPKYFMPVHGEYRMQKVHAGLAVDTGVEKDNIFIMSNGDVLALTANSARIAGHFNAQDIYVDGNRIGEIGAAVLKDRRDLSEDGVVLAVATVDFKSQMILSGPDILSRGFVYMRESGDLIRQSQRILFNAIRIALKNKDASIQSVNGAIVNAIRPFLYENTEREPIIIPMILTPDEE